MTLAADQDSFVDRHRASLIGYAFVAPFLVLYVAFLLYPLLKGIWISLHDWDLSGFTREFIGISNFTRLAGDAWFWQSFVNTVVFVVLMLVSKTVLALALALALNRQGKIFAVFRTIFFASGALSVSIVALIWVQVLKPANGLIANFSEWLGYEPIAYLYSTVFAMPSLVVASLWWSIGFPMILFLAGLQQIQPEIYEAAIVDNAGPWRRFTRITLPSLKRTLVLVLILETVSSFQLFGQSLLMTEGGPQNMTRSIVMTIYETGWRDWELGYSSAMSLLLFAIMFFIALAQLRIQRER